MSDKSPPRLRLRKELARHLRNGHPWVWADALALPGGRPLPTGTVVDLIGQDGRFLARGLYEANAAIGLRVYTLDEKEPLDGALVERRLREALASRRGAIDARTTDAFRWANGEGDRLPGVVVDVYGAVAVARFDGEAARTLRGEVARAVMALGRPLGVAWVIERSRGGKSETLAVAEGASDVPREVVVQEHGVRYLVDVLHGQKTGSFLDQRENRRAIRPYADGVTVGNLFSYTGGFSLHAALAGASHVASVDSASAAMALARRNFELNGLDPARHEFAVEDCFAWLERAKRDKRRFGLLVVDPPSFAPSEKALQKALGAYRDLFTASLAVVEEGGVLAAASCSSHVTQEAFLGTLRDASVAAKRPLRILEVRGQPADHPSLPVFPEGRYLKFVLCRA